MLALFAVGALWQGRAAVELARDAGAWADGEPVPAERVEARVSVLLGAIHHVHVRARVSGGGGAALGLPEVDDYYALFGDSVGDGALHARRDPASGRAALSWSMGDRGGRVAFLGLVGLLVLGAGAALGRLAWRALRELRTARAAARASDEVALEVVSLVTHEAHGEPVALEIAYRVPPPPSPRAIGYRDPAQAPPVVQTERFALADGRPLLLEGGERVVALRPDPASDAVTVVREGLWPFQA